MQPLLPGFNCRQVLRARDRAATAQRVRSGSAYRRASASDASGSCDPSAPAFANDEGKATASTPPGSITGLFPDTSTTETEYRVNLDRRDFEGKSTQW